jgi:hypothetical protein
MPEIAKLVVASVAIESRLKTQAEVAELADAHV